MTKYAVDLTLGDWSTSFSQVDTPGEPVLASGEDLEDAYVLAGASLAWETADDADFPGHPNPSVFSCGLYVPAIRTGPEPVQGQPVSYRVTTEDYRFNRLTDASLLEFWYYDADTEANLIRGWTAALAAKGYVGTQVTLVREQWQETGVPGPNVAPQWRLRGTVNTASATLSQVVRVPWVPCTPGEAVHAAARVWAPAASGWSKVVVQIAWTDAYGTQIAAAPATAVRTVSTVPTYRYLEATAPAGAYGFRLQVSPGVVSEVQVGDVFYLDQPQLGAGTFVATPDNLEPVAEFHGRISDVDATVYGDGLVYGVTAVDYTAEVNGATTGTNARVEERWEDRLEALWIACRGLLPSLSFGQNPAAHTHDAKVNGPDGPVTLPAQGPGTSWASNDLAYLAGWLNGGYDVIRAREVEPVSAGDYFRVLMDNWTEVLNATRGQRSLRDVGGEVDDALSVSQPFKTVAKSKPGTPFWIKGYMGQSVDLYGNVLICPVFTSDRVPDERGYATVPSTSGPFTVVDRHPATIRPGDGSVVHVPASVVRRDDVRWRMDKAMAPNVWHADSTGDEAAGVLPAGAYMYEQSGTYNGAVFDADVSAYEWGYSELVVRSGRNQVGDDADPSRYGGFLGNMRWVPALGTYYDAQATYNADAFTILPADLPGAQWPRLQAFRDPRGWTRGHLGRWVYVHGIDDRWNPHPNGLYFGQLQAASLVIEAGGRVTMTARVRHRQPGPPGTAVVVPDGTKVAVKAYGGIQWDDLPASLTPTGTDPALRWVDLATTTAN